MADWVKDIISDPKVATAIAQSRQTQQQVARLKNRAAYQDALAIRAGNSTLNEETMASVYVDGWSAMVNMRQMMADTGSYRKVAAALKADPGQFGELQPTHGLAKFIPALARSSAAEYVQTVVADEIDDAGVRQRFAAQARASAKDWMKRQPVDKRLMAFARRAEAFLRMTEKPSFQNAPADIEKHVFVEQLQGIDPIAALQVIQARLEEPQAGTIWKDMAQATAERIRDNHALADLAESRGVVPELHLPRYAAIPPGPRPEPRFGAS